MTKGESEKDRHRQDSRDFFGRVTSICAVIVAVAGLALSIWQGIETRQHNRLSLRPVIQFEIITMPVDPWPQVGLYIVNHGTGVAFVKSYTVYVDGEPIPPGDSAAFAEAARRLIVTDYPGFPIEYMTSMREAITPEDVVPLFWIDEKDYTEETAPIIKDALDRIGMHVEYESIYNEPSEAGFRLP